MNDARTDWPPASTAVTVVPEVPLGTGNAQEMAPVLPAQSDPVVHRVMVTVSNTRDVTIFETENPLPEIVTAAPTGPCADVRVIVSGVTLNLAWADGPTTSVANTVVPEVPLGTAKPHENAPELLVVSEPLVQPVMATLSNTSDANAADSEKLVPETVTTAPTGPCFGVAVIAGAVTVNVAEAVFVLSDAIIDCAPVGTVGITTVHEKLPFGRDVVQVEAAVSRSSVNARGALAANPVPVAVVELPMRPLAGFSEREAPTENVARPVFVPSVAAMV